MSGALSEHAIGKSAPWFILGVMLFSIAVRSVYIESSTLFVRGGAYRVVKEAMGPTAAKITVSALIFDFLLTAPISGVSAGHYLVGLLNELAVFAGIPITLPRDVGACSFRHPGNPLFLASEPGRDRRIQFQSPVYHESGQRDGRRVAGMGRDYGIP